MRTVKHLRFLLAVPLILLGGILGYGYAARHYYNHCLDDWKSMMGVRDPVEVHDWGDWPGRNQCYGYTSDFLGALGRAAVPTPEPNPHPERDSD